MAYLPRKMKEDVQSSLQQSPAFPLAEWTTNTAIGLTINVLRQGDVPQHIAFIMDGNRRFAKEVGIEVKAGHKRGSLPFQKVGIKQNAMYENRGTFVY